MLTLFWIVRTTCEKDGEREDGGRKRRRREEERDGESNVTIIPSLYSYVVDRSILVQAAQ